MTVRAAAQRLTDTAAVAYARRMRVRSAGLLALLGGCDAVFGLGPIAPGPDAGIPVDARVCIRGTPFATGVEVSLEGAYSVEGARFSADQTDAYLSLCPLITGQNTPTEIKNRCQLYTSRYDASTLTFGFFSELGDVSLAGAYDSYPTFTSDTSYLVFGSVRSAEVRLYAAANTDGMFTAAPELLPLPAVATSANEPYLLANGRTLYLQANGPIIGATLYRAHGDPPFFNTEIAAPINDLDVDDSGGTSLGEYAPVITDDELELFYASGEFATAGLDIFTSTRGASDLAFVPPARQPQLSAGGNDWPVWLSPDGCTLYYVNKGTDGIGRLFVTHR